MLRDDNYGALLPLDDCVDAHFFLLILACFLSTAILKNFEQGFEGFIWASEASGFGAGGSLKFVDEIDDLKVRRQCFSF